KSHGGVLALPGKGRTLAVCSVSLFDILALNSTLRGRFRNQKRVQKAGSRGFKPYLLNDSKYLALIRSVIGLGGLRYLQLPMVVHKRLKIPVSSVFSSRLFRLSRHTFRVCRRRSQVYGHGVRVGL